MKLFVITHSYSGDGASQMLLHAASHWTQKLGWQVDAVVGPQMTDEARQSVSESGMRLIARAHFEEEYDLALINCVQNIRFVDLVSPHVPTVLWAHEAETVLKSQISSAIWKQWFSKIALSIFQTDWQYSLFKKYFIDSQNAVVIPNGIPPYTFAHKEISEHVKPFGIACIGKLTPMKGQAELIRAVASIAQKYPVHCELIGGTEHLKSLNRQAQDILDKHPELFTIRGYMAHSSALKAAAKANLFCFPSQSESFGLAPLEAAAIGLPVVLADLPVYKSVGWVSGENCITFPANDWKKLQTVIEEILNDAPLRKRIAQNGQALASSHEMGRFLTDISDSVLKLVPNTKL